MKSTTFALIIIVLAAAAAPAGEQEPSAKRHAWTTSNVTGSPEPPPPYHVTPTFEGLRFTNPVEMERMPDSNRLLVVELGGKIHLFPNDPDCDESDIFIDLKKQRPKFRRTYGIAFHPRFSPCNYRQMRLSENRVQSHSAMVNSTML